jgi:hypothetical protein
MIHKLPSSDKVRALTNQSIALTGIPNYENAKPYSFYHSFIAFGYFSKVSSSSLLRMDFHVCSRFVKAGVGGILSVFLGWLSEK